MLQVAVLVLLQLLGLPLGTNTDTISDAPRHAGHARGARGAGRGRGPDRRGAALPWPRPALPALAPRSLAGHPGPGRVFGAIHVQLGVGIENLTVIAALTAVGIVFGFVADHVGRIGPAIVGHAIFNGVAVAAVIVTG